VQVIKERLQQPPEKGLTATESFSNLFCLKKKSFGGRSIGC
jgi:hypothetical protein